MQRSALVRGAVAMVAAAVVVGLATACDPAAAAGQGAGATSTPTGAAATPTVTVTATVAASPTATASAAAADVVRCRMSDVDVSAAHLAAVRPDGTGTGAVVVSVTNTSAHVCTLRGFPTVAGAGNGAPDHNRPLTVHRTGGLSTLRVAPGGKAWVKLTFVQVQGEASGYCVSGATPAVYPTIVLGVPGAGAQQIAMDDGSEFAECDDVVTVTALSSVRPS